jgi:hypothetical protein
MIAEDVPFGHKVALQALRVGDVVVKHGTAIGQLSAPVVRGGLVHVHNLRSRRG